MQAYTDDDDDSQHTQSNDEQDRSSSDQNHPTSSWMDAISSRWDSITSHGEPYTFRSYTEIVLPGVTVHGDAVYEHLDTIEQQPEDVGFRNPAWNEYEKKILSDAVRNMGLPHSYTSFTRPKLLLRQKGCPPLKWKE